MRTSTALLLASLGIDSFHGSLFTMAQVAPAPQPQHVARPRYYFPRHVKRQVVTNDTTPATSSPAAGLVGNLVGAVDGATGGSESESPSAAPVVSSSPEPASSSSGGSPLGSVGDLLGGALDPIVAPLSPVLAPLVTGVVDPIVAPVASAVDPVLAPAVDGVVAPVASAVVSPVVNPVVSAVVDPVVSGVVDPVAAPLVSAVVDPVVSAVAPVVSPIPGLVNGVAGPTGAIAPVLSAAAPVVSNVVDPVASNVVAPVVSGVVAPIVDPVASGVVDPVVSGVVDPVVSGVVDPVASGVVAPIASGVIDPVASGVVAPIVTGVVDPVVSGVVDPVASGVVAPVVTGVVAPIVTGVVDPIVDPVVSGVVDPVVSGVVDPALSGVVGGVAGPTGLLPGVVDPIVSAVDPIISAVPVPTGLIPEVIIPAVSSVLDPAVIPLVPEPSNTGILVGLSTVLSNNVPAATPAPVPSEPFQLAPGAGITGPGTGGFVVPTPTGSADNSSVYEPPTQTIVPGPPADNSVPPPAQPYTSLLAAPAPSVSTTATESGIPTSMPKVIAPPGGTIKAPENTTLIQIGFTHELNYGFVSTNPTSAQQIFKFLPDGVAYGLLVGNDNTKMFNLQPYDTSQVMGYITTLALMYIPTDLVNQLAVDLHTPNSGVYNNPDSTTNTLMSFINPAIPLIAGQPMDGTFSGQQAAATTAAGSPQGGAPFGGDSGNSQTVKSSAVAIGTATAAGVVLYGAAMGLVARRYRNKKKRARHSRNSSITGQPAWMHGAGYRDSHSSGSSQGRSIRSQGISAPVMSENSLGWN